MLSSLAMTLALPLRATSRCENISNGVGVMQQGFIEAETDSWLRGIPLNHVVVSHILALTIFLVLVKERMWYRTNSALRSRTK